MTDFGYQWYPEMEPLDLNWDTDDVFAWPDEDVSTSEASPDPEQVATVDVRCHDLSVFVPSDEDLSGSNPMASSFPSWEESPAGIASPETPHLSRRGRNRIRKGEGKDSRTRRPSEWDNYQYESSESPAFCCLREQLGYEGISLLNLTRVADMIAFETKSRGIEISYRSRAARRRKPCAFHWLDENWASIEELFRLALREVLGDTSGVKPRGRKRKPRPQFEDLLSSNL
jgi:hypothetical protein